MILTTYVKITVIEGGPLLSSFIAVSQ